ncbi:uncharacterized protein V1510DRAFT_412863 [Dipodascopsis tothii]|uniref:uncharacterized protein n=1 Tax=Dipodascopsis tothii TaxID=44089 RepID=UPI0034CF4EB6
MPELSIRDLFDKDLALRSANGRVSDERSGSVDRARTASPATTWASTVTGSYSSDLAASEVTADEPLASASTSRPGSRLRLRDYGRSPDSIGTLDNRLEHLYTQSPISPQLETMLPQYDGPSGSWPSSPGSARAPAGRVYRRREPDSAPVSRSSTPKPAGAATAGAAGPPVKRGRGRPRKNDAAPRQRAHTAPTPSSDPLAQLATGVAVSTPARARTTSTLPLSLADYGFSDEETEDYVPAPSAAWGVNLAKRSGRKAVPQADELLTGMAPPTKRPRGRPRKERPESDTQPATQAAPAQPPPAPLVPPKIKAEIKPGDPVPVNAPPTPARRGRPPGSTNKSTASRGPGRPPGRPRGRPPGRPPEAGPRPRGRPRVKPISQTTANPSTKTGRESGPSSQGESQSSNATSSQTSLSSGVSAGGEKPAESAESNAAATVPTGRTAADGANDSPRRVVRTRPTAILDALGDGTHEVRRIQGSVFKGEIWAAPRETRRKSVPPRDWWIVDDS